MKNKKLLLVILIAVLVGVLGSGAFLYKNRNPRLTKECPDEWIENRMPTGEGHDLESQYFIFQGERKEIKYYDVDWIKNNCSVQAQYVH